MMHLSFGLLKISIKPSYNVSKNPLIISMGCKNVLSFNWLPMEFHNRLHASAQYDTFWHGMSHNGRRVGGLSICDLLVFHSRHFWNHSGHILEHIYVDIYLWNHLYCQKKFILIVSNFGIFDIIFEKDSICYVKFSFSNNPPEILNIYL